MATITATHIGIATLPPMRPHRHAAPPERPRGPVSRATSDRDQCNACAAIARGEYHEMPGLSLTRDQAARLWHIEGALAAAVLEQLTCEGFLRKTERDSYVRADLPRH